MHHPAFRPVQPAPEFEFIATRDIALPTALWGMAMAAIVSAALAYAAFVPQLASAPQEPVAVSVLAA